MKSSTAIWHGKRSEYCKMVGGFALAKMSDGTYDYFPVGQPPQVNGQVDKGARILEKWSYVQSWRRIA